MTDKEIIIDKIKQLKDLFKTEREKTTTTNKGLVDKLSFSSKIVVLEELLVFINSLPAEQPSEELEEAANLYAIKQWLELKPFARRFFIAGAQWQKEQMMKGLCYETKVYRDEEGDGIDTPIESWLALENNEITNLPNIGLKEGDKVRVIIVKED